DRAQRGVRGRILLAGAVGVDAGSSIGIYSQFLSRCVGSTGVVHSLSHRLRILADCNLLRGSSQICAYLRPRWESTLASPRFISQTGLTSITGLTSLRKTRVMPFLSIS